MTWAETLIRFSKPIDELGPKPWPLDISWDHGETWRPMTPYERAEYDERTGRMFSE